MALLEKAVEVVTVAVAVGATLVIVSSCHSGVEAAEVEVCRRESPLNVWLLSIAVLSE